MQFRPELMIPSPSTLLQSKHREDISELSDSAKFVKIRKIFNLNQI